MLWNSLFVPSRLRDPTHARITFWCFTETFLFSEYWYTQCSSFLGDVILWLNLKPLAHVKLNWNKTEAKLKQIYFISTDHRWHCFISVMFQRLVHLKQNAETVIIGVACRNKSETFQRCFSVLTVLLHMCGRLKQICFISVLFQFHFTCASGLRLTRATVEKLAS